MNEFIKKLLNKACKSKKDIGCLVFAEQENFALFVSAPIVIKIEADRKK